MAVVLPYAGLHARLNLLARLQQETQPNTPLVALRGKKISDYEIERRPIYASCVTKFSWKIL
jgi:hypothetical protein